MDWLPYYFLPAVVIIIVWLLQRTLRTKKSIEKVEDQSIKNNEVLESDASLSENRLELEIGNDTKLTRSTNESNEEDCNSTNSSLSEYVESVSNVSSLVCRYEYTENEMQGMKLIPKPNEETDCSYINSSSSEYMDSISTLPSTIYINDYSSNVIQNMELTSRDKDYYSNNISISSSENIELSLSDNMGSSATLPSSYDSNDDSVKDIQYVEDFSDVGLYSTTSDENDIDDNMNNGFIEIEEIVI